MLESSWRESCGNGNVDAVESARGDASWIFRLELHAWKHARAVPRGGGAGNSPDLPGPGHVTAEGFKIGEGDCPKWAKIADMNKKKAEKRATSPPAAPPAPGAWIQNITGGAVASAAQTPSFTSAPATGVAAQPAPVAVLGSEPGPVIAFTVNGFTITTNMTQALGVVEQISAALRKTLGTGA